MQDSNTYNQYKSEKLARRYELNNQHYFQIEEFFAIIDYYALNDKFDKALDVVRMAEMFYPSSMELKIMRTNFLIENDDIEKAILAIREFEFSSEVELDIYLLKGKIAIKKNNFKSGEKYFDHAIKISEDNLQFILKEICYFLTSNACTNLFIKYIETLYTMGFFDLFLVDILGSYYYSENQIPKAIELYSELTNKYPLNYDFWKKLGKAYMGVDDFENAIKAFDFGLSLNTDKEMFVHKADCLLFNKQLDNAIALYHEALKVDSSYADARYGIAKCNEYKGLFDIAERQYLEIINNNKLYANAYYGLATVNIEKENYPIAEKYIRQALSYYKNPAFIMILCKILFERDNIPAARKEIEQIIKNKENIDNCRLWLMYSEIVAHEDIYEAIELLEAKFEKEFYSEAEVCFHLAFYYYQINEITKCVEKLECGLELNDTLINRFFELCPDATTNDTITEAHLAFKMRKQ